MCIIIYMDIEGWHLLVFALQQYSSGFFLLERRIKVSKLNKESPPHPLAFIIPFILTGIKYYIIINETEDHFDERLFFSRYYLANGKICSNRRCNATRKWKYDWKSAISAFGRRLLISHLIKMMWFKCI